ncbi:MAG TPA: hypothetical protein V6C72_04200, partial [Chroococcales cyanobacterium]
LGRFSLKNGKLQLPFVEFSGDELRLRMMGVVNFDRDQMHFEAAGTLPRSSKREGWGNLSINSFIGGLNSIPLVDGRIPVPSQPRAFAFKIAAPVDSPHQITGSIYKTFHWLPNKRDATPYPDLVAAEESDLKTAEKK